MILFEQTSRRFKVYGKNLRCQKVVRGHRGAVLACEYIKEHQMLVTSSADKAICFWDNRPGRFSVLLFASVLLPLQLDSKPCIRDVGHTLERVVQWKTKRSHVALKWVENTLYSADTKGLCSA